MTAQYERLLEGLGNRALTPPRDRQLDGEGAVGRDYMTRNRTQQRQVVSIHDGRIYTVTFTAPPGTFQAEQKEFEQILGLLAMGVGAAVPFGLRYDLPLG